jgi:AcrR family transcriptional regulator
VEKRDRLFEAALAEYERLGVAGARVDQIIAEAGVGWGTFFHYFPRKEDVLLAAGVQVQADLEAIIEGWLANPEGEVADAIEAVYEELARPRYSPKVHVAIVREIIASPIRFEAMLGDLRPMYLRLAEILRLGQERGEVRRDHPAETMAGLLNLSVLATVARTGLPGKTGALSRELRDTVLTTFHLVWSGIEADAEGRPAKKT